MPRVVIVTPCFPPSVGGIQTHSARYLLSITGIFALFFLKLYEGGLLTSLLAEKHVTPFRNIYGLAGTVSSSNSHNFLTSAVAD